MRSDFELDRNSWDLVITDDIGIVENAAMTSQDSKFSLQLIQGEVFDDNRIGMPWLTDMVSPQVSIAAKKQIIRDVIMSTPGAIELTRLEVAVDTDSAIATCEFEGITDNGDIFGTSITSIQTPEPEPEPSSIIAEYDYTTGRSFGLQLVRASEATYIDGGALKTVGVNIPRFESDGLLLENLAINVAPLSENSPGVTTNSSNSTKSPTNLPGFGGGEFALLTEATTTDSSRYLFWSSIGGLIAGNTYMASVWIYLPPGSFATALRLGTIGGSPNSTTTNLQPGMNRVTHKFVLNTGSSTRLFLWPYSNGSSTWVGVAGRDIMAAGCVQVEIAPTSTSYIRTSGAPGSRDADKLMLIKSGAKWLYREYIPLGETAVTKELVAYTGEVCPYGHLQKLRVWNRDLTSNEREVLGV